MKPRTAVVSTLIIAVGAFSLGRMLPRKNVFDDVPEWMQEAAGPSAVTQALLKRMETDFAGSLYATSEKIRGTEDAQSQRPVLFKNSVVVPRAAVALWENNEYLKLTQSPNAIMEKEAEGIDFWVAKVPMTKFWERWVETVAQSPEFADVPLPRPYEEWLATPKTPPRPLRPIAEPTTAPVTELEGRLGYMTGTPEPTQESLIKQLGEAQAEYAKSADATPDKLETLPPSQSLRPVLFRGKVVPQAAQTLYEDNEQLKLLKSREADYNAQAEDPEYWVPKVRPSAFWNTWTQTAAAKTAAASAGTKPKPGRSSTGPKGLEGKLGYMNGEPELGADWARAAGGKLTAAAAAAQLKDLAMRRGAAEQKRRTLQDRKVELIGMGIQFKMDKAALAADFESYKSSLAAYNREVAKLEEKRAQIDQRNPLAVAAFNTKLEKSEEKKRALDKAGADLNARQKAFLDKLQPLAEEEKRIDTEIPVLTENIVGLIKEFTAVQAQMFGATK